MRCRQLDHFAGTDKQDPDLGQILEQLGSQSHGGRRHADRMGADFGGSAYFLGHGEAALKQLIECGAQRAGVIGRPDRVLELAKNLRLAQHHGIETTGNTKGVTCGLPVRQRVGVASEFAGGNLSEFGQPVDSAVQFGPVGRAIDLGSVASGEDCRLGATVVRCTQLLQCFAESIQAKREPAAQIERRGGVVQT
jgi:hypothetical protein